MYDSYAALLISALQNLFIMNILQEDNANMYICILLVLAAYRFDNYAGLPIKEGYRRRSHRWRDTCTLVRFLFLILHKTFIASINLLLTNSSSSDLTSNFYDNIRFL
jgi:hypothetical protein